MIYIILWFIYFLITLSVQSEHGLDGDINTWELIGLKHHLQRDKRVKNHKHKLTEVPHRCYSTNGRSNLDDLLSVLGGVHGRLCEQDLAVSWVDVELLGAESVVPQVLHIVPVPHDPVLHRVVHLQHGAQLARLVAHHQVLQVTQRGQRSGHSMLTFCSSWTEAVQVEGEIKCVNEAGDNWGKNI